MSAPDESERSPSLIRELAHELRDALSPLASSVDLARLRKFDAEASRLLAEKVERGLRRTLAILDSFVLAEQAEHATLPLQVQPVALEAILQGARTMVGEGAHFSFLSAGETVTVRADQGQSARVLAAVLQHAAALASADRPVEVHTEADPRRPRVRVHIRIDPDNVPRGDWFASYRGGDGRMALRTAQQIMRLQGGTLALANDSAGAFELILQFADATQPQEERHCPPSLASRPADGSTVAASRTRSAHTAGRSTAHSAAGERVLIVDDSAEVRRAYREALVALGYTVLEAADAEQALSALEDASADVALIDIHLPRMNGYRLAQAIRARAGGGIYLVMLSGMALDAVTRGLAREAGFDDSLDKMAGPIALRELLEAGRTRGGSQ
ncbi:MAG TPA: response regulator [Steroidobacteraceae bacterium]